MAARKARMAAHKIRKKCEIRRFLVNKKANTVLFILGATVVNIVVTIVLFGALFALFMGVLVPNLGLSESALAIGFAGVFLAAVVLSFFVYRFALKILTSHIEMEKYFDPLFSRRYKPKPKQE
jgi:hypothetical protein